MNQRSNALGLAGFFLILVSPAAGSAHCDSLDGPVVADARKALEKGDAGPVLKWVKKEREEEVRGAFQKSLAVRGLGPQARELADLYFFETVVRIHRAGEGFPYTGLKPAGSGRSPAVGGSDEALEKGSVDPLVQMVTAEVAKGLRERFRRAGGAKARSEESIDAGRRYVEAYVEFVHFVEGILRSVAGEPAHGEPTSPAEGHEAHPR